MKYRANDANSEEEEEEYNEPVRRPGLFRIVTSSVEPLQQMNRLSLPQSVSNLQQESTKLKIDTQQLNQIEEAKIKQQEAKQKAKEQALKLQAEARARAEATRFEQVRLYQKQLQQEQLKKQQMLNQIAEQEKINKQSEEKVQKLKFQQEEIKKQTEKNNLQIKDQKKVNNKQEQEKEKAQQLKAQHKTFNKQTEEKIQIQKTQQQNHKISTSQQNQKQVQSSVQQQQNLLNKPVVQSKPLNQQTQQNNQSNNQNIYFQQKTTTNNVQQLNNNSQQQNKKLFLTEKKQENIKQDRISLDAFQPPILNHYSRMALSQDENQPLPKHQIIEDFSWQLQHRVPQEEIKEINPERIKIPEFFESNDIKSTVIVPTPAQSTRVQWKEFSEEEVKERVEVPRIPSQNWLPENDVEHVIQKTNYQPSRITRAWPPPGYNVEEEHEIGQAITTKAISDDGWIQQNENADDENNKVNFPETWKKQSAESCEIRNRIWPPIENYIDTNTFSSGLKLNVQWPPVELEEKEQQDIQVLQTHLPVKPQQRQWPPVTGATISRKRMQQYSNVKRYNQK